MKPARAGMALVLALLITSGATFANGVERESQATDAIFFLAQIQPGINGTYTSGANTLTFSTSSEQIIDASGNRVSTITLSEERSDRMVRWTSASKLTPLVHKYWLDSGTISASMSIIDSNFFGAAVGISDETTRLYADFNLFSMRFEDPLQPPCGLVTSLPGTIINSASRIQSSGCPDWSHAAPIIQAFSGQARAIFTNGEERIVFELGTAFPISFTEDGRQWILSNYQPGNASMIPSATKHLPIRTEFGEFPSEDGIVHPFPFSAALEFTMDPQNPNPVGTSLGTAGYYLADATFTERVDEGNRRLEWRLTSSNGWDAVAGTVTLTTVQGDDNIAKIPLLPPGTVPAAPRPIFREVEAVDRAYPVSAPVVKFAALEDLSKRWRASEHQVPVVPAWGFRIVCDSSCDDARALTWYGRNTIRGTQENARETSCYVSCNGMRQVPQVDTITVDELGQTVARQWTSWRIYDQAFAGIGTVTSHETGGHDQPRTMVYATSDERWTWSTPSFARAGQLSLLGALIALAWYFFPSLKFLVLGRSREILEVEHPVRREIEDLVRQQPGIHLHAIERGTGHPAGTIRHHLHRMELNGRLLARRSGGYSCYFLARGTDRRISAAASALKSPAARLILERVAQSPVSMANAAAAAGITAGAATHHATRLESAGLVERHKIGRVVELRATPLALQAIGTLA